MKTKEEIIKERYPFYDENIESKDIELTGWQIKDLMEEYAAQFKAPDAIPYQLCPKCNGQGIVSKPSYVPGDVTQFGSSEMTFQCDVCHGIKIIPMHINGAKIL